jgi:hypothetical protein
MFYLFSHYGLKGIWELLTSFVWNGFERKFFAKDRENTSNNVYLNIFPKKQKQKTLPFKRQCHEIFDPRFFSSIAYTYTYFRSQIKA